jgi:hypothetical protein
MTMMPLRINMKRLCIGVTCAIVLAGAFILGPISFAQTPSEGAHYGWPSFVCVLYGGA